MWHLPADTTDTDTDTDTDTTVAEHSARLQPSINLNAPITAFHVQLL